MNPITDQYWIPRLVPISTGWPMYKQRPSNPIRILQRIMTMIPAVAVLQSFEIVGVCVTCSNGALCHAVHTISFIGMKLANTMPVDCAAIRSDLVCNMDRDIVAPAGFDKWTRIGTIYNFAFRFDISVRGYRLVRNLQPELTMDSLGERFLIVSVDARVPVIDNISSLSCFLLTHTG